MILLSDCVICCRRTDCVTSPRCRCWLRPAARSAPTPAPPPPSPARPPPGRRARRRAGRGRAAGAPPSWSPTPSPCPSNLTRAARRWRPSRWTASEWARAAPSQPPHTSTPGAYIRALQGGCWYILWRSCTLVQYSISSPFLHISVQWLLQVSKRTPKHGGQPQWDQVRVTKEL